MKYLELCKYLCENNLYAQSFVPNSKVSCSTIFVTFWRYIERWLNRISNPSLCRDYPLTKNEHLTVVLVFLAITLIRLYFLTNTDLAEENVYLRWLWFGVVLPTIVECTYRKSPWIRSYSGVVGMKFTGQFNLHSNVALGVDKEQLQWRRSDCVLRIHLYRKWYNNDKSIIVVVTWWNSPMHKLFL